MAQIGYRLSVARAFPASDLNGGSRVTVELGTATPSSVPSVE
jgi:hypothetical protein